MATRLNRVCVSASKWKSKNLKFHEILRLIMESMRNDLAKRMDLVMEPETYQKGMF